MKNRTPGTRQRGLTLVEVMLAMAIMGIGIVGLISAASRCLAIVRQARSYEAARHLVGVVELKFQEYLLEQEGEDLSDTTQSGTFPSPHQHYTWLWELRQIGDGDDETAGLFEVRMRVGWAEGGHQAFEEVLTYIYAPEQVVSGTVISR